MKSRVSAYDVAKAANVSQSTVSRVLNNYPYVKKETREKVLIAIKELGFSPDEIARSLAMNKTHTIGLIVEDLSNPFYAETAHIILREAASREYQVIILDAGTDSKSFKSAFETLVGKRVDGVIVASIKKNETSIKKYMKQNIPIVFYNRIIVSDNQSSYIEVDNLLGAKKAVQHLVELNHKRIAFISGPTIYSTFCDRLTGYKKALKENNIPYRKELVYQGEITNENVLKFVTDLMQQEDAATAYFASTDQIALVVMDAVSRCNLLIPEDISVIGFDNIDIANNPIIALTTVSQQKELMAELALKKLLEFIEDKDRKRFEKVTLPPKLIIRETTGENKKAKGAF